MAQSDPARDPLRRLAEAALARQETAQRQRADDQAAVDRDQADQAEAADQAQTLAEAQQLAAEVFGAEGAELAAGLTWTAVGPGRPAPPSTSMSWSITAPRSCGRAHVPPTARSGNPGGRPATGPAQPGTESSATRSRRLRLVKPGRRRPAVHYPADGWLLALGEVSASEAATSRPRWE